MLLIATKFVCCIFRTMMDDASRKHHMGIKVNGERIYCIKFADYRTYRERQAKSFLEKKKKKVFGIDQQTQALHFYFLLAKSVYRLFNFNPLAIFFFNTDLLS